MESWIFALPLLALSWPLVVLQLRQWSRQLPLLESEGERQRAEGRIGERALAVLARGVSPGLREAALLLVVQRVTADDSFYELDATEEGRMRLRVWRWMAGDARFAPFLCTRRALRALREARGCGEERVQVLLLLLPRRENVQREARRMDLASTLGGVRGWEEVQAILTTCT